MAETPRPSATVVLLQDGASELELLLLQRAAREGRPGPWVFPGGRVEPADVVAGEPASLESARNAAVRETHEEARLRLAPEGIEPISRWITPEVAPKRFDTWFFVGAVPEGASVVVDRQEMVAHRWLSPAAALAAHQEGEIRLAPPTFVTVTWLGEFERAADALRELPRRELVTFRPRICRLEEGAVMLYPGDAGYQAQDPHAPGPRHRVWATAGWHYRYERS